MVGLGGGRRRTRRRGAGSGSKTVQDLFGESACDVLQVHGAASWEGSADPVKWPSEEFCPVVLSSSTRRAKGSPTSTTRNGKGSRSSSAWSPGPSGRCSGRWHGRSATDLGEPDGVIVFDPSAFAKKGTKSVGVARQWCGRLGKIENCQVGVYMAYVSRKEHALVNTRLYLPEEWTRDRKRCKAAGVPKAVRFRTRHELALEMLEEHGAVLPHAWVAGDDEMGRPAEFRLKLRGRGERYLLAVPSNTLVRDRDAPPPEYAGRGPHPQNPFVRVDRWCAALPESAWTTIEVRDGEKGPLTVDVVKCRVRARTPTGGTGPEEVLFITRERQANGTFKHDYYLSNADPEVPLEELARVAKAAHRIEECFQACQGGGGPGRLSGEELDRLASPPNPGLARRVVPESGDAAGEKSGPLR